MSNFHRLTPAACSGADLRLASGGSLEVGSTLAYHASEGRLETVTANLNGTNRAFTYSYKADSYGLTETVTGPTHTVTNTWDATRDLLQKKENKVGGTNISTYDYTVNALGQRGGVDVSGSAFTTQADWTWEYNSRGELVSAHHANTSASRRFFSFDGIGNRTEHREGTSTSSGGTPLSYTPDSVNQYTAIGNLNPTNGTQPLYDDDGNLTRGPLPIAPTVNAALTWDGENRLRTVGTTSYVYDGLGRRVMKTTGTGTNARTYVFYDGWNLIAEYGGDIHNSGSAPAVTLLRTHAWGTDLSGSAQGAGGVGGLLATQLHTGGNAGVYYPLYDGNGNVTDYLNASGTVAAHYEYGPFGESLVFSGTVAAELPFRFSTKYQDAETGLCYYGYRYYDPFTGRWPNRDPIEEVGGVNLYCFLQNDSSDRIDLWGFIPLTLPSGLIVDDDHFGKIGFCPIIGANEGSHGPIRRVRDKVENALRGMDYAQFTFHIPVLGVLGFQGGVAIDRYNRVYVNVGAGGRLPVAGGGLLTGNWVNNVSGPASPQQIASVLSGESITAGGAFILGGQYTATPGGQSATGVGTGARGVGVGVSWGWELGGPIW